MTCMVNVTQSSINQGMDKAEQSTTIMHNLTLIYHGIVLRKMIQLRSCVNVEVAVLGTLSLTVHLVSVLLRKLQLFISCTLAGLTV